MADFQKEIGSMRPFFGKRYHFEPKPDITAYELAQVLKMVSRQTGKSSLSGALNLPEGVDSGLAQHFRVEEH